MDGRHPGGAAHLLQCLEYQPYNPGYYEDMVYYFSNEEIEQAHKKFEYPKVQKPLDPTGEDYSGGDESSECWGWARNVNLAQQLTCLKSKQLDNLDVNEGFLERAKLVPWKAESVNFIHDDVRNMNGKLDDYDLVLLFDIIEHLPKEDGIKLLKTKVPKLVFTPIEKNLGEGGNKDTGIEGQDHKSSDRGMILALGYATELVKNVKCSPSVVVDYVWAAGRPEVSILMPAYNAEKWIAKAIEPCQAQTLKDWELIIVDDGSTDKTQEVVRRYIKGDARIKTFAHQEERVLSGSVQ